MSSSTYLLAGQASELKRLQLQSRVWQPSGRRLLTEIGDGTGLRPGCRYRMRGDGLAWTAQRVGRTGW
jgi:hypothetical protein